ncbi:hypothetical protein SNEBB_003478 [Seison nebaliae]|nr:hypothetical protein SNEBB_003478 [Seison nebaliae]
MRILKFDYMKCFSFDYLVLWAGCSLLLIASAITITTIQRETTLYLPFNWTSIDLITMEDILNQFNGINDDPINIKWAHAVNDLERFNNVLESRSIHIIESDINLRESDKVVILAHPPANNSDLVLDGYLYKLLHVPQTDKGLRHGIKLDFKHPLAIDPTLSRLYSLLIDTKLQWRIPIFLNADIISTKDCSTLSNEINSDFIGKALNFVKKISNLPKTVRPLIVISVGWRTDGPSHNYNGYDEEHVEKMTSILHHHFITNLKREPIKEIPLITFPIRASLLFNAIPHFDKMIKHLKDESQFKLSFTIWSSIKDIPEGLIGKKLDEYHEELCKKIEYFIQYFPQTFIDLDVKLNEHFMRFYKRRSEKIH